MLPRALLFFALILYVAGLTAQDYTFSHSTGTYTELDVPISLNNGEIWDDPQFVIPIGFTFTLFDQDITSLYIEDFFLGGILTPSDAETGIASLIIGYGADLIDRGFLAGVSESEVSYQPTGEAGDRILKVEWKNAGFYDDIDFDGESSDYVNVQLWLYEGSNDIEMRFGPSLINFPDISFNGDPGPSVGIVPAFDFDFLTFPDGAAFLVGDVNDPDYITTLESEEFFLNGTPPDGMIYRFSMMTSSTEEPVLSSLRISPNPVSDILTIENSEGSVDHQHVRIYDQLGRVVLEEEMAGDHLSVAALPAGLYALRVEGGPARLFVKM